MRRIVSTAQCQIKWHQRRHIEKSHWGLLFLWNISFKACPYLHIYFHHFDWFILIQFIILNFPFEIKKIAENRKRLPIESQGIAGIWVCRTRCTRVQFACANQRNISTLSASRVRIIESLGTENIVVICSFITNGINNSVL